MNALACPTWGMFNEVGCHCVGFPHTYVAEDAEPEFQPCEHVTACGRCDRCCDGQCRSSAPEPGGRPDWVESVEQKDLGA